MSELGTKIAFVFVAALVVSLLKWWDLARRRRNMRKRIVRSKRVGALCADKTTAASGAGPSGPRLGLALQNRPQLAEGEVGEVPVDLEERIGRSRAAGTLLGPKDWD
jgi:hypothetical protein